MNSFNKLTQSRINRAQFVVYFLLSSVILVNLYLFGMVEGDLYFVFFGAFLLVVTILSIRRLHDMNRTGWWSLLFPLLFIIKFSLLFVCVWGGCEPIWLIGYVYESLPWIAGALLLVLMVTPGTIGPNSFDVSNT